MPSIDEVKSGKGPCLLWRYIGEWQVAPHKITPGGLLYITRSKSNTREMVVQQVIAVIEASKAINRMMGKPEMSGLECEE